MVVLRERKERGNESAMQVDKQGNYAVRKLEDGRTVYVFPLMFGRARLGIGNKYAPLTFDATY